MDIYNSFATDSVAEVEGKWFPLSKTAKVKVARTGNERYNAEFRKQINEKQVDLADGGEGADQLAEQILVDVQAKTILLDWEGLSFQGKAVPYTLDMARTMLKVKDFRKRITGLADSFENFRVKSEEAQGNASSASTAGA